MDAHRRLLLLRAAAAAAVLVLVPGIVLLGTINDEAPITVGQPSPRTIEADRPVEVQDVEGTQQARAAARLEVSPVQVTDDEAVEETVRAVRDLFGAVRLARAPREVPVTNPSPGPDGEPAEQTTTVVPSTEEQLAELEEDVEVLGEDGLRELVALSDSQLQRVETETEDILQVLLRQRIAEDELDQVLSSDLQREINFRSWPGEVAGEVVDPLVRAVMRPTVRVDTEQTEQRQQAAADAVEPVVEEWDDGDPVVEAGEVVTPVQLQALEQLGVAGSSPGVTLVRALTAMVLVVIIVGLYLLRSQRQVWDDAGRLLVLASVVVLAAVLLVGVEALVDAFERSGLWYAYPVAGIVLLVSVLISPQVGTMTVLPLAGVALLTAPSQPALAIYTISCAVLAAPMATGVSTRVALRRASVRAAAATPVIAAAVALVFGPRDQVGVVLLAATIGGIAGAGLLQGLLPAFENIFRLATVTALLDLADRNHPLLRELEAKAIGSYNHSVMVASLTERCCREIGANHLLGQVAALYHDIGKVRQPHFFIENQRGIANPHDDLEPRVSAVIIQNHVKDGVEMAERHRLPPDVVSCIGSHHGTMLVTYFYRQAVAAAGGDEDAVDEQHFRYKGHKPRSKEAAVLVMADCCEATTRAMAMDRGTLPGDEIEQVVDKLLHERVEDGQFDECELTFVELQKVRDTLVEALTGIYHPRIQYPSRS